MYCSLAESATQRLRDPPKIHDGTRWFSARGYRLSQSSVKDSGTVCGGDKR